MLGQPADERYRQEHHQREGRTEQGQWVIRLYAQANNAPSPSTTK